MYASSTTTSALGRASASARTVATGCAFPVGLFGEHTKTTSGSAATAAATWSTVRTKSAGELERRVRCVREPRQPRVQQVRGLEREAGPARPAVGRQELGEDLVRAARDPHAVDGVTVDVGDRLAELAHLPVGVAVQGQPADGLGEVVGEPGRQRQGTLVRVQARGDVELRRDVGRDVTEAGARFGGHAPSASAARASMARAWPTSPSRARDRRRARGEACGRLGRHPHRPTRP